MNPPNPATSDGSARGLSVSVLALVAAATVPIAIGLLALVGWGFDRLVLASFGVDRIPMAPSTALLFVFYGVALFCRICMPQSRVAYRLGAAVHLVGATLVALLLVLSFQGIFVKAELLGFPVAAGDGSVGHMSPVTALGFLCASLSFLASPPSLAKRPWRAHLAAGSAGVLLVASFIFLLAYLFGTPLLAGPTFILPALSTALAFVPLGLMLVAVAFHSTGPSDNVSTPSFLLLLTFACLATGIVTIGCLYSRNIERSSRAAAERQLSTIADLKVSQLVQWRKERLGDAGTVLQNPAFTALVRRFFGQPEDAEARRQLQGWIGTIQTNYQYARISLFDTRGFERLAIPNSAEPASTHLANDTINVLRSGRVTFLDFHRDAPERPIHLEIVVPILDDLDGGLPLGVIVFSIDPTSYLYPLIQRWPTPSQTAETLLVRREGNEVVYLNELRFQKNTALSLRASLDQKALPAVQAALGQEGVIEGVDYRGGLVVAALRAIPDSPWFLVARMDAAEVYAPLREKLKLVVLLVGALLLGAGASVGLIWRQEHVRSYRNKYEAEAARAKLAAIVDSAEDAIIGKDLDGTVTSWNAGAEHLFGYRASEMIGQNIARIIPSSEQAQEAGILQRLRRGERVEHYEAVRIAKDGRHLDVSLTISPVRDAAGTVIGAAKIARDITARKRAEFAVITSEVRYRRLFEAARDGILILDAETGEVLDVNPFLIEMMGFPREQMLGKRLWELGFFKDISASKHNFAELQQKEYVRYDDLPLETAAGRRIDVEFVSNVYQADHQKVIQCNIRDITERRAQAQEIARLNRLYAVLSLTNQTVLRVHSYEELFASICRAAAECGSFPLAWVGWPDPETHQIRPVAQAGRAIGYLDSLVVSSEGRPEGRGPTGTAFRENRVVVINDTATDERMAPSRDAARRFGLAATAAFPVLRMGQVVAVFTVYASESGEFGAKEIGLLKEVADDISFALDYLDEEEKRRRVEEHNRQLATVVESADEAIMSGTLDGTITSWNRGAEKIYGYTEAEAVGQAVTMLVPPERKAELVDIIERVRGGESITSLETARQRKDGTVIDVSFTASPLRNREGHVIGTTVVSSDITARKHAEKALRAEQALLDSLVRTIPDHIYFKDRKSRFIRINDAMAKWFGMRSPDEAIGKTDFDVFGEEHAWTAYEEEQQIMSTGDPLVGVVEKETWPDGRVTWVSTTKVPLRDAAGNITGLVGISRNITEYRQAEEALRQEMEFGRALIQSSPAFFVAIRPDGTVRMMNQSMLRAVGYASEEVVGADYLTRFVPERERAAVAEVFRSLVENKQASVTENHVRTAHGSERLVEWHGQPVLRDGAVEYFFGLGLDITERKQAEEKIREQAALLDNATDAIYVTALDFTILYWNRGAERIYGWTSDEILNRKTTEFISPDLAATEALAAVLLEQGSWSGERSQKNKSGQSVEVFSRMMLVRNEQCQPKAFFVINTDITEKKQLEAQFLRAQRLESIGALASGIAHDLNNVLAPIIIGVPLLREMVQDPTARRLLRTMQSSAQRGAAIVKQVLTFARGVEGERMLLQPSHLIWEMEKLAAETFPKNIQVEFNVAADLWPVLGDATQLHQALMNLCVNARDAMPGGGVLTMDAANIVLSKETAAKIPGAQQGSYVCLRVIDTGTGIPPEVEAKLFEPFFTTKGAGKGTGLGLSTVLGIARSHGGFVQVTSKVGQGSTFELYVPATTTGEVEVKPTYAPPWPHAHGECVLVVDDEAAVREVARQALMEFGYRVITAGRGAEALGIFQERRQEIQLVLTDMMMPEMDGPTLVAALRVLDPQVRIVGITGMADAAGMSGLKTLELSAMLAKPFTIEKLLEVIRGALPATVGQAGNAPGGGGSRPAPSV